MHNKYLCLKGETSSKMEQRQEARRARLFPQNLYFKEVTDVFEHNL